MLVGRRSVVISKLGTTLAAAIAVSAIACGGGPTPQDPPLPIQTICGSAVAREIAYPVHDVAAGRRVTVTANEPFLLRFTAGCRGTRVAPQPSSLWNARALVRGDRGIVAGVFSSPGGTFHLLLGQSTPRRSVEVRVVAAID
ncbi:MAG: hypothetical protein QOH68_2954 [Nocardioidaceae bacterium]|nr:hypothetical protein [Nocardioidaceae bacterium]